MDPKSVLNDFKESKQIRKRKKVTINLTSECILYYKKDPPSEIEKVVFKVETDGLTNKKKYAGDFENTRKFPWGSYELYGEKLNMSEEEIEKIRKQFKNEEQFQKWVTALGNDFYYPLICIRDWWNKTFRFKTGVGILNEIQINDIIIEDIIEDSDNFNFYVNINGVSDDENEQTIIPVTIQVQVINNTGGLNKSAISTGGYKKRRNFSKRRKLTKRRKILKKRKMSKRRRKTRKY